MPPIAARGPAPEVFACGYCHTPSGQGRPENAALAALPAAHIIAQVENRLRALVAFQGGARHGPGSQPLSSEVGKLSLGNMIEAAAFAAAASL